MRPDVGRCRDFGILRQFNVGRKSSADAAEQCRFRNKRIDTSIANASVVEIVDVTVVDDVIYEFVKTKLGGTKKKTLTS